MLGDVLRALRLIHQWGLEASPDVLDQLRQAVERYQNGFTSFMGPLEEAREKVIRHAKDPVAAKEQLRSLGIDGVLESATRLSRKKGMGRIRFVPKTDRDRGKNMRAIIGRLLRNRNTTYGFLFPLFLGLGFPLGTDLVILLGGIAAVVLVVGSLTLFKYSRNRLFREVWAREASRWKNAEVAMIISTLGIISLSLAWIAATWGKQFFWSISMRSGPFVLTTVAIIFVWFVLLPLFFAVVTIRTFRDVTNLIARKSFGQLIVELVKRKSKRGKEAVAKALSQKTAFNVDEIMGKYGYRGGGDYDKELKQRAAQFLLENENFAKSNDELLATFFEWIRFPRGGGTGTFGNLNEFSLIRWVGLDHLLSVLETVREDNFGGRVKMSNAVGVFAKFDHRTPRSVEMLMDELQEIIRITEGHNSRYSEVRNEFDGATREGRIIDTEALAAYVALSIGVTRRIAALGVDQTVTEYEQREVYGYSGVTLESFPVQKPNPRFQELVGPMLAQLREFDSRQAHSEPPVTSEEPSNLLATQNAIAFLLAGGFWVSLLALGLLGTIHLSIWAAVPALFFGARAIVAGLSEWFIHGQLLRGSPGLVHIKDDGTVGFNLSLASRASPLRKWIALFLGYPLAALAIGLSPIHEMLHRFSRSEFPVYASEFLVVLFVSGAVLFHSITYFTVFGPVVLSALVLLPMIPKIKNQSLQKASFTVLPLVPSLKGRGQNMGEKIGRFLRNRNTTYSFLFPLFLGLGFPLGTDLVILFVGVAGFVLLLIWAMEVANERKTKAENASKSVDQLIEQLRAYNEGFRRIGQFSRNEWVGREHLLSLLEAVRKDRKGRQAIIDAFVVFMKFDHHSPRSVEMFMTELERIIGLTGDLKTRFPSIVREFSAAMGSGRINTTLALSNYVYLSNSISERIAEMGGEQRETVTVFKEQPDQFFFSTTSESIEPNPLYRSFLYELARLQEFDSRQAHPNPPATPEKPSNLLASQNAFAFLLAGGFWVALLALGILESNHLTIWAATPALFFGARAIVAGFSEWFIHGQLLRGSPGLVHIKDDGTVGFNLSLASRASPLRKWIALFLGYPLAALAIGLSPIHELLHRFSRSEFPVYASEFLFVLFVSGAVLFHSITYFTVFGPIALSTLVLFLMIPKFKFQSLENAFYSVLPLFPSLSSSSSGLEAVMGGYGVGRGIAQTTEGIRPKLPPVQSFHLSDYGEKKFILRRALSRPGAGYIVNGLEVRRVGEIGGIRELLERSARDPALTGNHVFVLMAVSKALEGNLRRLKAEFGNLTITVVPPAYSTDESTDEVDFSRALHYALENDSEPLQFLVDALTEGTSRVGINLFPATGHWAELRPILIDGKEFDISALTVRVVYLNLIQRTIYTTPLIFGISETLIRLKEAALAAQRAA